MSAHKFAYLLTLLNHFFIFKGAIESVIDVVLGLSGFSFIHFSLSFVVFSFFYCKEKKA